MFSRRLIALCLMTWGLALYGCSSKKAPSSEGGKKGSTKTVKEDGDDETNKKEPKKDPCDAATLTEDEVDADAAKDEASTEPCPDADSEDEKDKPLPPDGAFYDAVLNPPAKSACHTQGFLFEWKTQACLTVGYPAAFACDRTGILLAFENSPEIVAILDQREAAKWLYDQCGVQNGKPYVLLACPTTDDQDCTGTPVCKTQDELDAAAIKICTTSIHY